VIVSLAPAVTFWGGKTSKGSTLLIDDTGIKEGAEKKLYQKFN